MFIILIFNDIIIGRGNNMQEILVYGFLIFFICSFIGYFMEVIWCYLASGKLVNRGFLSGPIIPIYGLGAVIILFCLLRYYEDPVVVFVFGVIITSSLEYFTSFLLEKLFHNRWWDYSTQKYNLNGRICLKNSFAFGILSLAIIYLVTPLLVIVFSLFTIQVWTIIAIALAVIIALDIMYSVVIAYNLRNRIIIVEELKNEKIAQIPIILEKRIKEMSAQFKAFPNRLLKAFPTLENENHNFYDLMRKYRFEEKNKREKDKKKNKDKTKKKKSTKKK